MNKEIEDTNNLAREAFNALGAAQDALRALSARFEGIADYRNVGSFDAEDYFDMVHELEYDATGLTQLRNHVGKIIRKTNKEASNV